MRPTPLAASGMPLLLAGFPGRQESDARRTAVWTGPNCGADAGHRALGSSHPAEQVQRRSSSAATIARSMSTPTPPWWSRCRRRPSQKRTKRDAETIAEAMLTGSVQGCNGIKPAAPSEKPAAASIQSAPASVRLRRSPSSLANAHESRGQTMPACSSMRVGRSDRSRAGGRPHAAPGRARSGRLICWLPRAWVTGWRARRGSAH